MGPGFESQRDHRQVLKLLDSSSLQGVFCFRFKHSSNNWWNHQGKKGRINLLQKLSNRKSNVGFHCYVNTKLFKWGEFFYTYILIY